MGKYARNQNPRSTTCRVAAISSRNRSNRSINSYQSADYQRSGRPKASHNEKIFVEKHEIEAKYGQEKSER